MMRPPAPPKPSKFLRNEPSFSSSDEEESSQKENQSGGFLNLDEDSDGERPANHKNKDEKKSDGFLNLDEDSDCEPASTNKENETDDEDDLLAISSAQYKRNTSYTSSSTNITQRLKKRPAPMPPMTPPQPTEPADTNSPSPMKSKPLNDLCQTISPSKLNRPDEEYDLWLGKNISNTNDPAINASPTNYLFMEAVKQFLAEFFSTDDNFNFIQLLYRNKLRVKLEETGKPVTEQALTLLSQSINPLCVSFSYIDLYDKIKQTIERKVLICVSSADVNAELINRLDTFYKSRPNGTGFVFSVGERATDEISKALYTINKLTREQANRPFKSCAEKDKLATTVKLIRHHYTPNPKLNVHLSFLPSKNDEVGENKHNLNLGNGLSIRMIDSCSDCKINRAASAALVQSYQQKVERNPNTTPPVSPMKREGLKRARHG